MPLQYRSDTNKLLYMSPAEFGVDSNVLMAECCCDGESDSTSSQSISTSSQSDSTSSQTHPQYESSSSSSISSLSSSQTVSSSSSSNKCKYKIDVVLNWSILGSPDLDLYTKVDGFVAYYGMKSAGGLTLDKDAQPACNINPSPPESITGTFNSDKTFYVWYNQWSDCADETSPTTTTIKVKNLGETNICVNGNLVLPNGTFNTNSFAYGGYDTGSIPSFAGGTEVIVTCGSC